MIIGREKEKEKGTNELVKQIGECGTVCLGMNQTSYLCVEPCGLRSRFRTSDSSVAHATVLPNEQIRWPGLPFPQYVRTCDSISHHVLASARVFR